MRRAAALCVLALLAGACDSGGPGARRVRVIVSQDAERMVVLAEVASTPAQRARGLMFRQEVPAGTGMLFVFPAPQRGGFYMKDTLVPLHILFIRDGRVLEIRTMQPCAADPCPLTVPAQPYSSALEVPLGVLGSLTAGARAEVFGRLESPS
ncbi:MAG: DUF192 domain-containing protein [Actinomycetota bacterium]